MTQVRHQRHRGWGVSGQGRTSTAREQHPSPLSSFLSSFRLSVWFLSERPLPCECFVLKNNLNFLPKTLLCKAAV